MEDCKFIAVAHCDETCITVLNDKLIMICPHHPPKLVKNDGTTETLKPGQIVYY